MLFITQNGRIDMEYSNSVPWNMPVNDPRRSSSSLHASLASSSPPGTCGGQYMKQNQFPSGPKRVGLLQENKPSAFSPPLPWQRGSLATSEPDGERVNKSGSVVRERINFYERKQYLENFLQTGSLNPFTHLQANNSANSRHTHSNSNSNFSSSQPKINNISKPFKSGSLRAKNLSASDHKGTSNSDDKNWTRSYEHGSLDRKSKLNASFNRRKDSESGTEKFSHLFKELRDTESSSTPRSSMPTIQNLLQPPSENPTEGSTSLQIISQPHLQSSYAQQQRRQTFAQIPKTVTTSSAITPRGEADEKTKKAAKKRQLRIVLDNQEPVQIPLPPSSQPSSQQAQTPNLASSVSTPSLPSPLFEYRRERKKSISLMQNLLEQSQKAVDSMRQQKSKSEVVGKTKLKVPNYLEGQRSKKCNRCILVGPNHLISRYENSGTLRIDTLQHQYLEDKIHRDKSNRRSDIKTSHVSNELTIICWSIYDLEKQTCQTKYCTKETDLLKKEEIRNKHRERSLRLFGDFDENLQHNAQIIEFRGQYLGLVRVASLDGGGWRVSCDTIQHSKTTRERTNTVSKVEIRTMTDEAKQPVAGLVIEDTAPKSVVKGKEEAEKRNRDKISRSIQADGEGEKEEKDQSEHLHTDARQKGNNTLISLIRNRGRTVGHTDSTKVTSRKKSSTHSGEVRERRSKTVVSSNTKDISKEDLKNSEANQQLPNSIKPSVSSTNSDHTKQVSREEGQNNNQLPSHTSAPVSVASFKVLQIDQTILTQSRMSSALTDIDDDDSGQKKKRSWIKSKSLFKFPSKSKPKSEKEAVTSPSVLPRNTGRMASNPAINQMIQKTESSDTEHFSPITPRSKIRSSPPILPSQHANSKIWDSSPSPSPFSSSSNIPVASYHMAMLPPSSSASVDSTFPTVSTNTLPDSSPCTSPVSTSTNHNPPPPKLFYPNSVPPHSGSGVATLSSRHRSKAEPLDIRCIMIEKHTIVGVTKTQIFVWEKDRMAPIKIIDMKSSPSSDATNAINSDKGEKANDPAKSLSDASTSSPPTSLATSLLSQMKRRLSVAGPAHAQIVGRERSGTVAMYEEMSRGFSFLSQSVEKPSSKQPEADSSSDSSKNGDVTSKTRPSNIKYPTLILHHLNVDNSELNNGLLLLGAHDRFQLWDINGDEERGYLLLEYNSKVSTDHFLLLKLFKNTLIASTKTKMMLWKISRVNNTVSPSLNDKPNSSDQSPTAHGVVVSQTPICINCEHYVTAVSYDTCFFLSGNQNGIISLLDYQSGEKVYDLNSPKCIEDRIARCKKNSSGIESASNHGDFKNAKLKILGIDISLFIKDICRVNSWVLVSMQKTVCVEIWNINERDRVSPYAYFDGGSGFLKSLFISGKNVFMGIKETKRKKRESSGTEAERDSTERKSKRKRKKKSKRSESGAHGPSHVSDSRLDKVIVWQVDLLYFSKKQEKQDTRCPEDRGKNFDKDRKLLNSSGNTCDDKYTVLCKTREMEPSETVDGPGDFPAQLPRLTSQDMSLYHASSSLIALSSNPSSKPRPHRRVVGSDPERVIASGDSTDPSFAGGRPQKCFLSSSNGKLELETYDGVRKINKVLRKERQPIVEKMQQFESAGAWWEHEIKLHKFTVIIFYKSFYDENSKTFLQKWNTLATVIKNEGGLICAVTSQSQALADVACTEWRLQFDTLSDEQNELASLYCIPTMTLAVPPYTLCEPGIVIVNSVREFLYYWNGNQKGAERGRDFPDPIDIWVRLVQGSFSPHVESSFAMCQGVST